VDSGVCAVEFDDLGQGLKLAERWLVLKTALKHCNVVELFQSELAFFSRERVDVQVKHAVRNI